MVERPQVLGRQALLGIQARGTEAGQDPLLDVASRIVCFQTRHGRFILPDIGESR
jgi:hypothetical protein